MYFIYAFFPSHVIILFFKKIIISKAKIILRDTDDQAIAL